MPLHLRTNEPDNRELRLITTLTHFGTATDVTIAELRLEAFLPADEADQRRTVRTRYVVNTQGGNPTS